MHLRHTSLPPPNNSPHHSSRKLISPAFLTSPPAVPSNFQPRTAGAPPGGGVHHLVLGRGRHPGVAVGDRSAPWERELAAHLGRAVSGDAGDLGGGHDPWHHPAGDGGASARS